MRFDSKIGISNIEFFFPIIFLAAKLESASFTLIQCFLIVQFQTRGPFLKILEFVILEKY